MPAIRNLLLFCLMGIAAIAGWILQPRTFLADSRPELQLAKIVPEQFGDWQEIKQSVGFIVNPQAQEILNSLYSQMLLRIYVNVKGQRVMLSIAYGRDQRSYMAVHYPEICYPAQGFSLSSNKVVDISINGSPFTVRRIETNMGQRYEPVTYWTTIGEYKSLGGFNKRLAELQYGFDGRIPDGLLFRVSSIGKESGVQFELQEGFIGSLLSALHPEQRILLTGIPGI